MNEQSRAEQLDERASWAEGRAEEAEAEVVMLRTALETSRKRFQQIADSISEYEAEDAPEHTPPTIEYAASMARSGLEAAQLALIRAARGKNELDSL